MYHKLLFVIALLASIILCCPADATAAAANDGDRGFRHPGGLHTQADFDRVKAQLAAGNEKVTAAYNVLKNAAYAQANVTSNPLETIVRGGGNGENYINAARGATMAYQNALRWKIEDNEACAKTAVRILMAWARKTKAITGNSDQCLAVGLYGYEFAQAAELMRDYEGWSSDEFEEFCQWMLNLWYPKAIHFLRSRNGTWENTGKWWQAPGHYWSNWGLCNAMCVVSIGILCDDVFIYNQGMSYFKYDQVGTFRNPRTEIPIKNDGLVEFLGNLVVTVSDSELENGAYGQLGQMNESGRDTGHSSMALGLAVDLAKIGWNQGDDLFAYMDHRLAAGIEYVAAQTQSVANLPWTNYHYGSSGYYYSDSRAWLMTEPALGAQMRPYWGSVIGIYEGVKGVKMPFSEVSYANMGIDEGGQGSTSGGYDHLGYSVLMNTREPQLRPADEVPTELSPLMEYDASLSAKLIPSLGVEKTLGNVDGSTTRHSELGGLVNTYQTNNRTCLPKGHTVKLCPQLPEGEEDTGRWQWNTGEQTRDITVTTDRSQAYRVTYINSRGVESELLFTLAVEGDNTPSAASGRITYNGTTINDTTLTLFYGEKATLNIVGQDGYGTYKWQNGSTNASLTTGSIKNDTTIVGTYLNQSYTPTEVRFHLKVRYTRPDITVNEVTTVDTLKTIVEKGDTVVIGPYVPATLKGMTYEWSNGSTDRLLTFNIIAESGIYQVRCLLNGEEFANYTFKVFVNDETTIIPSGKYLIRHIDSDTYLTSNGLRERVDFQPMAEADKPSAEQKWSVNETTTVGRYSIQSLDETAYLSASLSLTSTASSPFLLNVAAGGKYAAMKIRTSGYYILVKDDLTLDVRSEKELTDYPYEFIPTTDETEGISLSEKNLTNDSDRWFDLMGRQISNGSATKKGIYIVGGKKVVIK
ncbi:MAG: alginate lyase family protein [Prevotella sp.]|nr:alginate lyase family protein [Prevotella sp.]